MPLTNLNEDSLTSIVDVLFKDLFILGAVLYLVFAIVVIRQIAIMKKTLITSFSPIIQLLGFIHFGAAAVILLFFVSFL